MIQSNLYVTIDFETYWSTEYSLSRLTTEAYVRDTRFKAHMMGVKIATSPTDVGDNIVIPHEEIPAFFEKFPLDKQIVINHHAGFDGFILSQIYNQHPRFFCDTLGMSRWLNGRRFPRHSLANVSRELGVGEKGTELINSKGVRDFSPELYTAMAGYCALDEDSDVNLTWRLFQKMLPHCSPYSLDIIDWCIKAYTQPRLAIDMATMQAGLAEVENEKRGMMQDVAHMLEVDDEPEAIRKALRSAGVFAKLLVAEGAEPPMKVSPATGKETYAFAKNDSGMLDLLGHGNPRVVALAEAKIGAQSSILETRMQRLIDVGSRGLLPSPLNAFGAMTTGRLSGGDKLNLQNVPKKSAIRAGITAPDGHDLVVVDSSNIELRVEMKLAGQKDMNQLIAAGGDPYCDMAESIFNHPVTKDDADDRFFGKLAMLSCGYGAGKDKFALIAKSWGITAKRSFLDNMHDTYRNKMYGVVALWKQADSALAAMAAGIEVPIGLDEVAHTIQDGILIPGINFIIKYPNLRREAETGDWMYGLGKEKIKLFGAKIVENISQCLAGAVIGEQMRITKERWGLTLQVHDELIMVVPQEQSEQCLAETITNMSTPPPWWPSIVLAAEGGIAKRYSEAK